MKFAKPFATLLFGASLALASEPATFDRTLPITGPVDLDVKSNPGGVTITSGSGGSVRVHAVIKPLYGRLDFDVAEANIRALVRNPPIEQVGNHIRIGYAADSTLLRAVSLNLEIITPRHTQVQAHTESGGIRVAGINGPVNANTSSGRTEISDVLSEVKVASRSGAILVRCSGAAVVAHSQSGGIQVVSINGTVNAQTTSGRIEVSDVSGEVYSTTHSGGISIDNAKGAVTAHNSSGSIDAFQLSNSVRAETKSGAIRIAQIQPSQIRAVTDSGSIQVELASRRGYAIDAQSHSGKVSSPVLDGLTPIVETHRRQGQIGGGGPLVDLDSHSSAIRII